jgi:small-conductance mechanosensitive channel
VDEQAAEEALRNFGAQSGLAHLVEQYIWYFVVGFALLFLKDSVTNALAGIAMFLGSNYDENMVCYIHTNGTRRPARITKTTLFSTSFYLYEIKNDKVEGGTLLTVPNSELKTLRIERPLDTLHTTGD